MATAKKAPAKALKPAAKAKVPATAKKPSTAPKKDEEFRMPTEVKDWIDQAMSRMKSMQGKIDRLETENKELKSYKKWAEHRILGSSRE
jgi:hypothetical protein